MSLFGAFTSSKNGLCSDTILRLCLFQAVLLPAQQDTMCLTTVITALKCHSRNRPMFIATDMSLFGAFKSSKNGVCLNTILRLCLLQVELLPAQHNTMRLTTVITALKCHSRNQPLFIATDMSLFGAFKSSKNGVCSNFILRLCLFQAVLLPAQQ
jgi:uncharacterized protein YjhX (UPF0386 family)